MFPSSSSATVAKISTRRTGNKWSALVQRPVTLSDYSGQSQGGLQEQGRHGCRTINRRNEPYVGEGKPLWLSLLRATACTVICTRTEHMTDLSSGRAFSDNSCIWLVLGGSIACSTWSSEAAKNKDMIPIRRFSISLSIDLITLC